MVTSNCINQLRAKSFPLVSAAAMVTNACPVPAGVVQVTASLMVDPSWSYTLQVAEVIEATEPERSIDTDTV